MKKISLFLPLILLVHLVLLVLLRFTAWPEMTLWPYLLNKGLLPYRDIVVIYPPTLILFLSFLGKIFGVTLLGLKIYTWILILLTDLLVFLTAKKLTKNIKIALISLAFYILWQPFFEGNAFWFDLVLAPLALLVFYFSVKKKFLWSGLLFGLAITIKQTAFWFFVPIILTFWLGKELRLRTIVKFILGLAIPLFICLVFLFKTGLFQDFWRWAVDFGVFYLPRAPGQVQPPTIKNILALCVPYGFLLLGAFFLLIKRGEKQENQLSMILIIWALFACLGTYPRFEYFHFQPSLPFLAIISGLAIFSFKIVWKKKENFLALSFLILIFLGTLYLQARFYRLNWQKPTRFFEADVLEMASWLKDNTKPSEKIYILNSWDHLYALSDTLPAVSPLIHTLPWHLEYPGMQEKYMSDLTKNKPRIVVFQPYSEKGLGSYKPEKIDEFVMGNYTLDEVVAGRFWVLKIK